MNEYTPVASTRGVSNNRQGVDLSVGTWLRPLRTAPRRTDMWSPTSTRGEAESGRVANRPQFRQIPLPTAGGKRGGNDLGAGDVIWMVPELVSVSCDTYRLERGHWGVHARTPFQVVPPAGIEPAHMV